MAEHDHVDFPPSLSRRLVLALSPLAFPLPGLALGLALGRSPNWSTSVIAVVAVVGLVSWALYGRRRPALTLDHVGIRDSRARMLVEWHNVAMVWIGDEWPRWTPRPLRSPSVRIWDAPALDYAMRTGFKAHPRLVRAIVWTTLSAAEAAAPFSQFTDAPVHTGRPADLRRLLSPSAGVS